MRTEVFQDVVENRSRFTDCLQLFFNAMVIIAHALTISPRLLKLRTYLPHKFATIILDTVDL